jgi:hypothetical protein
MMLFRAARLRRLNGKPLGGTTRFNLKLLLYFSSVNFKRQ